MHVFIRLNSGQVYQTLQWIKHLYLRILWSHGSHWWQCINPVFSEVFHEESDPKLIRFQYIYKVLDQLWGDNLLPNRRYCLEQGCFLSIYVLWEFKSDGKLKCFNCIMNINSTDGVNTSFTAKQKLETGKIISLNHFCNRDKSKSWKTAPFLICLHPFQNICRFSPLL